MTTVITRIFEDEAAASKTAKYLRLKGLPDSAVKVIAGGDADDLSEALRKAQVHEDAVKPYADSIKKGHAALIVRATYVPLGAPRITRDILARRDTVDMGDVMEEHYFTDPPEKSKSILKHHPRFLTARIRGGGPVMGPKTVIRNRKATSAVGKERHVSRLFWPMPLLSTKERRIKVHRGGRYMSKSFWPMPLLSHKERRKSVVEGGGPVFSRALGWPTS